MAVVIHEKVGYTRRQQKTMEQDCAQWFLNTLLEALVLEGMKGNQI